MKIRLYPRALLATGAFVILSGYALSAALDVRASAVTAGVFSVIAYVTIELLLTWNPGHVAFSSSRSTVIGV